jgi:ectoine hydroxylase-related dioxygenase (phytanoyl-CoA dioxygenase family)
MITEGQKAHFEAFGFVVMRGLFSPEEMEEIGEEFDGITAEERDGRPYGGEQQSIQPFIETRPRLLSLVADDRIYETTEDLLGPGFVWVGSDGNHYVYDTPWHADGLRNAIDPGLPDWHYPIIKIGFYLDPLRKDTGCLRVIPGSHRPAFGDLLGPTSERGDHPDARPFGVAPAEVPSHAIETDPGDVVFFNQDIHHGSFGGPAGRRMFAISFATEPTTDEHVAFLRRAHDQTKRTLRPHVALTGSDDPRIRGVVAKLVELGF